MTFGGEHRRIFCRPVPTVKVRDQGLTGEAKRGSRDDGRGKPGARQGDVPDRSRRGADAGDRLRDDGRGRARPSAGPAARRREAVYRPAHDRRVPSAHVEERLGDGARVPGRAVRRQRLGRGARALHDQRKLVREQFGADRQAAAGHVGGELTSTSRRVCEPPWPGRAGCSSTRGTKTWPARWRVHCTTPCPPRSPNDRSSAVAASASSSSCPANCALPKNRWSCASQTPRSALGTSPRTVRAEGTVRPGTRRR